MERLSIRNERLEDLADLAAALARLAHYITSLRRLTRDSTRLRVLIVHPDEGFRRPVRLALHAAEHRALEAASFTDALVLLATDAVDAVVTIDQPFDAGASGMMLLSEVHRRWPFVRRVLCAASGPQPRDVEPGGAIERVVPLPLDEEWLLASL
jgi:DNA-binding NtrC family response regulator